MRLLRFISYDSPEARFGALEGEKIRVLSENPLHGIEKTSEIIPLKAIKEFLPPVDPPDIIALGGNYREHVKESKAQIPSHPLIFVKTTNTLTAHKQPNYTAERGPR